MPVPGVPPPPFYITGGTLSPDAPSYVERQADKALYDGLRQGDFCYVLTSRQMGKSSLMVRTVRRLRQERQHVAVLDLTAIGQNLTVEQWYDGLMARLGQQLDLEDELLEFWRAHGEWGPLQRWTTAFEKVVLPNRPGQIIVFVDEIDIVRSLPFSTDEFFAAIRECHNRRSRDPLYGRLSFCLLGVAAPTDLIRDTRLTPFNIGRRIELNDFTFEEARPLADGFASQAGDKPARDHWLRRILYWTHGHPYLTQRLCQAVSQAPQTGSTADIDRICHDLFLSPRARERDDNLLFVRDRLLRCDTDLTALLGLYQQILQGKDVPDDESNPLVSLLLLSGIARVVSGRLEVRNRIYERVFDREWVRLNLPGAEVRRQKGAFHKGLWRGAVIVFVLVLIRAQYFSCRQTPPPKPDTGAVFREVQRAWRGVSSYQDQYEATLQVKLNRLDVSAAASGYLQLVKPNRFKQSFASSGGATRLEVEYGSDGRRSWIYKPGANEYAWDDAPASFEKAALNTNLANVCGPLSVAPLFRLWFYNNLPKAAPANLSQAHRWVGEEDVKERVLVLSCDYDIREFLAGLGWIRKSQTAGETVPLSLWVAPDGMITHLELNLTRWATHLVTLPDGLQPQSLRLALNLSVMRWNEALPASVFEFAPPLEAKPMAPLAPEERTLNLARIYRDRVLQQIPPRFPDTPANLLDLTPFYNASLREAWHVGAPGNDFHPLPAGLLYLGRTLFDVRGLVQLSGEQLRQMGGRFPSRADGIPAGRKGRRVHFLHSCCWGSDKSTRVASYFVHYADGQRREIPVKYGEDLLDWHLATRPSRRSRANLVWSGRNHSNAEIGIFVTSWDNPLPDTPIARIDFVSADSSAAPFLLAITIEP